MALNLVIGAVCVCVRVGWWGATVKYCRVPRQLFSRGPLYQNRAMSPLLEVIYSDRLEYKLVLLSATPPLSRQNFSSVSFNPLHSTYVATCTCVFGAHWHEPCMQFVLCI